ncbi:MAG: hypothetical protein ACYCVB_04355 [Bacilli bacterium]
MNDRTNDDQPTPISHVSDTDEKQLRDSFAAMRQARIGRIDAVYALWNDRAKHVEETAFGHFQEQNLEKIAELMDEKRRIEQRLTRLQRFLQTYEVSP